MEAQRTQPLKIRVPLGTVVKRKRGGALLGELTAAGQTLLVAQGGRGGLGAVKPNALQQPRGRFVEQVGPPLWSVPGRRQPNALQQPRSRFLEQLGSLCGPSLHLPRMNAPDVHLHVTLQHGRRPCSPADSNIGCPGTQL